MKSGAAPSEKTTALRILTHDRKVSEIAHSDVTAINDEVTRKISRFLLSRACPHRNTVF
jgi:hypothetical protein